jgi:hypothetical protein
MSPSGPEAAVGERPLFRRHQETSRRSASICGALRRKPSPLMWVARADLDDQPSPRAMARLLRCVRSVGLPNSVFEASGRPWIPPIGAGEEAARDFGRSRSYTNACDLAHVRFSWYAVESPDHTNGPVS